MQLRRKETLCYKGGLDDTKEMFINSADRQGADRGCIESKWPKWPLRQLRVRNGPFDDDVTNQRVRIKLNDHIHMNYNDFNVENNY